eukprot:GILJ01011451.1.p1 GENE.GILJ01011451.1~~GILJ01011451.1.p1  ORF type:complete len:694 (+),score=153.66 GILJ01011451.1:27-2084(+)
MDTQPHPSPYARILRDRDVDPYKPVLVEDLLQGLNDWRNIQDIVRLTFKALYDVVKAQGEAIRQLEKQVDTKASKMELHSLLDTKVNTVQFTQMVNEIQFILSSKPSIDDLHNATEDKVKRSDMQTALAAKASSDEVRVMLEGKASVADISHRTEELHRRCDELKKDLSKKASHHDVHTVTTVLEGKVSVAEFKEQLEQKANKQSVINALARKANKTDIDALLSRKAEVTDLQHVLSSMAHKADEKMVEDLRRSMAVERKEVDGIFGAKDMLFKDLTEDLNKVREDVRTLRHEAAQQREDGASYANHLVQSLRTDLRSEYKPELDSLHAKLMSQEEKKADKKALVELKTELYTELKSLADRQEKLTVEKGNASDIQQSLSDLQQEVHVTVKDLKNSINTQLQRANDDIEMELRRKANIEEVITSLHMKANSSDMQAALDTKASRTDLELVATSVDELQQQTSTLASSDTVFGKLDSLGKAVEEVGKEVLLKANIKDVVTLLDLKANVEDVNRILSDIHKEIDLKASQSETTSALMEQAVINEALCAENSVARFIWKSGEVKKGYAVPWEVQSSNTCPDNFLWEREKTSIITVAPGLYEICFGFFASKKPTVQLLVNGEPVLSAVNSASYVLHHSSGRLNAVGRHSAGNVSGLSLVDFLVLPPRARVSISYNGELGAEGFLSLRKL